jgi:hypothetical protein
VKYLPEILTPSFKRADFLNVFSLKIPTLIVDICSRIILQGAASYLPFFIWHFIFKKGSYPAAPCNSIIMLNRDFTKSNIFIETLGSTPRQGYGDYYTISQYGWENAPKLAQNNSQTSIRMDPTSLHIITFPINAAG